MINQNDGHTALLRDAGRLAMQLDERFTPLRRHVYKSLLESDKPLGAYELMQGLEGVGAQKPSTVYRTLDWLLKLGLVRKVASISKYVALPKGHSHDPIAVVICRDCGKVDVMDTDAPVTQLLNAAKTQGYKDLEATFEILGHCTGDLTT